MKVKGKVIKAVGGFFYVAHDHKVTEAKARKKLSYNNREIMVGDNVELSFDKYGKASVESLLPRRNFLTRPSVANVDIAVINGRPGVWGDAQAAVCFNSGLLEGGIEDEYSGSALKDDWTCRVRVRRKGVEKPYVGEFSYGEAKLAGLLTKESWAKYPRKMLFARARSDALRKAFPDVLKGIRSAEEIEDISDAAPTAPKSKLFGAKREKAEPKPAEDVEVVNAPTAEGGAKVEKSDKLKPKAENALEELRLKLEAEGLSDAQLVEYARRQESILLADGTLDEFGAKKILNAWGVVKEIIATMPKA